MRVKILLIFVCFSVASYAKIIDFTTTPSNTKYRYWTNSDNKKVFGSLIKYDDVDNRVCIKRSANNNTSHFWYSLSKLSSKDVNYVISKTENDIIPSKNLYDESFYERSRFNWKFYDTKYFSVNNQVKLTKTSHIKYYSENSSVFGFTDVKFNYGKFMRFVPRGNTALPENYGVSAIEFIKLLVAYGVTEDDLMKLKWFFSAEDIMNNPSKILDAYGIDHSVGSYNYDRIKSYIKMGIPLLAFNRDNLGDVCHRYIHTYYLSDKNKDVKRAKAVNLKKVHYVKLPR